MPAAADPLLRALLGMLSPAGARARLSILIFHRVLPERDPLQPDEPDQHRFDEVCGWIRRWFNVLPLDQASRRLREGSLPARSLCITFDDGYADNQGVALPVLQKHGLPATFFVASGYLDGGRMWNDTLIEAVRRCRTPVLRVDGLGLGIADEWAVDTAQAKRAAIGALIGACKYRDPAQRSETVACIAQRSGAAMPDDLMMSRAQVRALADAGMQVGAHTVHHPIMARIDDGQARLELQQNRAELEEIVGRPVTLLAYPNGRPGRDYTRRDVELAREAGFACAVSTAAGAAHAGSDPLQLPRFTPWDRGRWAFGARMLRNLREPVAFA